MIAEAQLYDSSNIETLCWPETEDGHYAKEFLLPLLQNGLSHYFHNIAGDVYILKVDQFIFPVIVITENYSNAWVCSPYAHYISYGKEFLGLVKNLFLSRLIKNFLTGLEKFSRLNKMNSVVYVNNWLFSTDLYPHDLSSIHLQKIVQLLTQKFPKHALIMRSLNGMTTPTLLEPLNSKGFHLLASRYVFVTDAKNASIFKTRILKSDLKLWKESPYQIVDENDLHINDCNHLLNLHLNLYVIKRSYLQPHYNSHYFKMLLEKKLLRFKVLKLEGEVKGVAGYYKRGNTMMCPIFGYEKNQPDSNDIYRLLNTALLLEAQKEGLLFNQSAGAGFFKSLRRAEGSLEYIALYTKHLQFYRKFFWSTLKFFINTVGTKYMKKY